MPANEQAWRNQKQLHRVFAASGVVLLVSTVLMLAVDHSRQWKEYQGKFLRIELTQNEWEQKNVRLETQADVNEKREKVAAAQAQPLPSDLLAEFQAELQRAGTEPPLRIEELAGQLTEQFDAGDTERAISTRAALVKVLRGEIAQARFQEDRLLGERKFQAADVGAKGAALDIAVRDNSPTESIQQDLDQLTARLDELTGEYQAASQHRKDLLDLVNRMTTEEDKAVKDLQEAEGKLADLERTYRERRSTFFTTSYPGLGKRFLELPIFDAFNSPLKISNLWHEDNKIEYGSFGQVRRFDRCTTCHQGIDKTQAGSADEPLYVRERLLTFELSTPTPAELAKMLADPSGDPKPQTTENVFGMLIVEGGLVERTATSVRYVAPDSRGARARFSGEADRSNLTADEVRTGVMTGRLQGGDARPKSAQGAAPGLRMGDVLVRVGGDIVRDAALAEQMLVGPAVDWGRPISVTVRRGVPHPFAAHPRLDLFVGSLSPHPISVFGCTNCHEGQGSATAFEWASHAPNDPIQRREWKQQYGWFDNPHWTYPQFPRRFAESSCVRCHHEIVELESSERYPETPAPKVVHGYNLVRKFGCFGCHEINGFGERGMRVGPDLRLEPNFYAVAHELSRSFDERTVQLEPDRASLAEALEPLTSQSGMINAQIQQLTQRKEQLAAESPETNEQQIAQIDRQLAALRDQLSGVQEQAAPILSDLAAIEGHLDRLREARQLAEQLIAHPEDTSARHRLKQMLDADAIAEPDKFGRTFADASHALAERLKDAESAGVQRKVGPSLRHVAQKLDPEFLFDWIRDPKHFRPDTRMPQFFGLWDHLEAGSASRQLSEAYEPIEILGIATYLRERSQPLELISPPQGIDPSSPAEKVARGKMLFETRGCLVCHKHSAFPEADAQRDPDEIVQGPNLSSIAAKFSPPRNQNGRQWLYTWLRDPTRYHSRTLMPNLFLEPIMVPVRDDAGDVVVDAAGKVLEKRIDPAADIVDFLLHESVSDWEPAAGTLVEQSIAKDTALAATLDELMLVHLQDVFFKTAADKYRQFGIPQRRASEQKGAEIELVVPDDDYEGQRALSDKQKLLYIGRKSIGKYGCYACHDVPGFDDAKPIATTLADWGRKETSRLAFEHIAEYIEHQQEAHGETEGHAAGEGGAVAADGEMDPFYREALLARHREGFIYQKLREPRSYDYLKTEYKKYSERLRMPHFNLTHEDREAIITFVLGLVADPPSATFLYRPDEQQAAIQTGRKVLEKYNCGGCHLLETEKLSVAVRPGYFGDPGGETTYPFLSLEPSPEQADRSFAADRRGLLSAALSVVPVLESDGRPLIETAEGDPLEDGESYNPAELAYRYQLWQPAVIEGKIHPSGPRALRVEAEMIEGRHPPRGGYLARYLVPRAVKLEMQANNSTQGKGAEAWSWVPPPLIGEGTKVQSEWLHDFLLDPHPIRPAVILRMPKFNMSSDEATQIVRYFAAVQDAEYPYQLNPRQRQAHLADAERRYLQRLQGLQLLKEPPREYPLSQRRFDDAMKIVTDVETYCAKCHTVGDYSPGSSSFARAPNLADVHARLRPTYVRNWVALPSRILPFTAMPENIKYAPEPPYYGGISQDLYHGTSIEQIDAVVDLLMNYDSYASYRSPVTPLIRAVPAATGGDKAAGSGGGATSGTDAGTR